MKILRPSIIFASFAVFNPFTASATLLVETVVVGMHDVRGNTTSATTSSPSANFAHTGFSGIATFANSFDTGGSNDGFYGSDSQPPGFPVASVNQNDGFMRFGPTVPLIFSVTNHSSPDTTLRSLFFDATQNGASPSSFDYKKSTDLLWSTARSFTATASVGFGNSQNYSDFIVNLSGIYLLMGETIQFRFQSASGGRLDNIALTAIPETASFLGLAILIGGGLMTRSRRSINASPTLA